MHKSNQIEIEKKFGIILINVEFLCKWFKTWKIQKIFLLCIADKFYILVFKQGTLKCVVRLFKFVSSQKMSKLIQQLYYSSFRF